MNKRFVIISIIIGSVFSAGSLANASASTGGLGDMTCLVDGIEVDTETCFKVANEYEKVGGGSGTLFTSPATDIRLLCYIQMAYLQCYKGGHAEAGPAVALICRDVLEDNVCRGYAPPPREPAQVEEP